MSLEYDVLKRQYQKLRLFDLAWDNDMVDQITDSIFEFNASNRSDIVEWLVIHQPDIVMEEYDFKNKTLITIEFKDRSEAMFFKLTWSD